MGNTVATTEDSYPMASTEANSPIRAKRPLNMSTILGKSDFSPLCR